MTNGKYYISQVRHTEPLQGPPQVSRESAGSQEAEMFWRTALALQTEGNCSVGAEGEEEGVV